MDFIIYLDLFLHHSVQKNEDQVYNIHIVKDGYFILYSTVYTLVISGPVSEPFSPKNDSRVYV